MSVNKEAVAAQRMFHQHGYSVIRTSGLEALVRLAERHENELTTAEMNGWGDANEALALYVPGAAS